MLRRKIQTAFLWILIPTFGFILSCKSFDMFGEITNPFDPSSNSYAPPQTEFVGGPANDEVIHVNETTLQWRHANQIYWPTDSSGYTVAAAVEFAYRINFGNWSEFKSGRELLIDSLSYWTFDTSTGIHSFQLSGLEDRQYFFEVLCHYPTEIEEGLAKFRRFIVDALQGPGLILSPAIANIDSNGTFVLTVVGIDVNDLMGVHAFVKYNPDDFLIQNYTVQSDSTHFLMQTLTPNIDDFSFIENDETSGLLDVNIAITTGVGNGVNGTGEIIRLTMNHIGTRGNKTIEILPESALRNTLNEDQLILIQNATINIW
ncbi:MAG: hypothetical protein HQ509_10435 [Candidatus Marinimicrobia bacterium]|nr:hypothetical protein [Candidatus Neomarinimicrobiota bacterium]